TGPRRASRRAASELVSPWVTAAASTLPFVAVDCGHDGIGSCQCRNSAIHSSCSSVRTSWRGWRPAPGPAGPARSSGGGRLVLLDGEAGIGKTSLAREFAAGLRAPGRVLWGGCEALTTPAPLAPLLDVAEQTGGGVA